MTVLKVGTVGATAAQASVGGLSGEFYPGDSVDGWRSEWSAHRDKRIVPDLAGAAGSLAQRHWNSNYCNAPSRSFWVTTGPSNCAHTPEGAGHWNSIDTAYKSQAGLMGF